MPIQKYITTLLLLISPVLSYGSLCEEPFFTITELLNHDPANHHIFTCKILETCVRSNGYESLAVIQDRFAGNPRDSVYIKTGGEKLIPTSEWLIFSVTRDGLHYHATVCDILSTQISGGDYQKMGRREGFLGKVYLDVINQYKVIRKQQFTGPKEIYGGGRLIAKGNFINGIPDGDWIHYSMIDHFKGGVKKSEISYRNGALHGEYKIYHENRNQNVVLEERIYKDGLIFRVEREFDFYKKQYEYLSEDERKIITTYSDSSGVELKRRTLVEVDFNSELYKPLSFRNGYYFNKLNRDSSKYYPLAEGHYLKGTRIGAWTFYNKKGEVVETKHYPDTLDKVVNFQIYDDEGNVRFSGLRVDGKRIGRWKRFYKTELDSELGYSSKGDKIFKIRYYSSGGFEYTTFSKNKKHGPEIIYNKDNSIRSINNYKNGQLHGMSIEYNMDGSIKEEFIFKNSRKSSIHRNENSTYYINGYLNGHYVKKDRKTGKKVLEGDYWNGYKVGVWIKYKENGHYSKLYYPENREELLIQNMFSVPKLTETYNKEGKLINSWKY